MNLQNNTLDDMLENVSWGEFEIGELFNINRGRGFPKRDWIPGDTPIVSTTGLNNGVNDYIENTNDKTSKNSITVAGTGTVGSTFYHKYEYNIGEWVLSLELKDFYLDEHLALFLTSTISNQKDKYSYAYKLGNARLARQKILLPVNSNNEPDWYFMREFMMMVEERVKPELDFTENIIRDNRELDEVDWGEFEIGKLFEVFTGATIPKNELLDGLIPRISATDGCNGISCFTDNLDVKNYRSFDNFISISFLGSVFYHKKEVSLDMKVHGIRPKHNDLDNYISMFLINMINQFTFKYSYGYQLSQSVLKRQKILLPIKSQNEPDWDFMREYMKRIENDLMYQTKSLWF